MPVLIHRSTPYIVNHLLLSLFGGSTFGGENVHRHMCSCGCIISFGAMLNIWSQELQFHQLHSRAQPDSIPSHLLLQTVDLEARERSWRSRSHKRSHGTAVSCVYIHRQFAK